MAHSRHHVSVFHVSLLPCCSDYPRFACVSPSLFRIFYLAISVLATESSVRALDRSFKSRFKLHRISGLPPPPLALDARPLPRDAHPHARPLPRPPQETLPLLHRPQLAQAIPGTPATPAPTKVRGPRSRRPVAGPPVLQASAAQALDCSRAPARASRPRSRPLSAPKVCARCRGVAGEQRPAGQETVATFAA